MNVINITVDWLHLLATAVWIGGMAFNVCGLNFNPTDPNSLSFFLLRSHHTTYRMYHTRNTQSQVSSLVSVSIFYVAKSFQDKIEVSYDVG